MPKDVSGRDRLIQRHFAPSTCRSIFRPEIKAKAPLHSSRIVYPLTEHNNDLTPPKELIAKPPGEVGRLKRQGYNLEKVLDWPEGEYAKVQKFMRDLANQHLDKTELLSKQKPKVLKIVYKQAKEQHPRLLQYKDDWVIDDFLGMILKNSATRGRRRAKNQEVSTGKDGSDSEPEGENPPSDGA